MNCTNCLIRSVCGENFCEFGAIHSNTLSHFILFRLGAEVLSVFREARKNESVINAMNIVRNSAKIADGKAKEFLN